MKNFKTQSPDYFQKQLSEAMQRFKTQAPDYFQEQFNHIIIGVAKVYRVTPEDILGRSRPPHVVEARQAAMMVMFKCISDSFPTPSGAYSKTARLFNRNHGTVMHARSAMENRIQMSERSYSLWKKAMRLSRTKPKPDPINYQI